MNQELKTWTVQFVKHKDLPFRKLVDIKEIDKENKVDFKFKDKDVIYFILDKVDENVFKLIDKIEHKTIVCLNTDESFNFLIKNWKKLAGIKNLSVLFVNLKVNEKWMINPHVHDMIADTASLETGLRAMFDTCNGKILEVKKDKKKKSSMFEESEEGNDISGEEELPEE